MAVSSAAANSKDLPLYRYLGGIDFELPQPFFNVINGGVHADSGIDTQEFMLTPVKRKTFRDGVEKIANVYHTLKGILSEQGLSTSVGDEGGFAPRLETTERVIITLIEAIKRAGYIPGKEIAIALDPAASEFYESKSERYNFEGRILASQEMVDYYEDLINKYPEIISIEDGFAESDWNGFKAQTELMGNRLQIVGDDVFVTNPTIFKEVLAVGIINFIALSAGCTF